MLNVESIRRNPAIGGRQYGSNHYSLLSPILLLTLYNNSTIHSALYCNSLISTLARNAPIQDVSLTLAALNCIIRCKCTLANHYLQHA